MLGDIPVVTRFHDGAFMPVVRASTNQFNVLPVRVGTRLSRFLAFEKLGQMKQSIFVWLLRYTRLGVAIERAGLSSYLCIYAALTAIASLEARIFL